MGEQITQRDRVWAEVITRLDGHENRVKIDNLYRELNIRLDNPPARRTVLRTLEAMVELEILEHTPGSSWWRDAR